MRGWRTPPHTGAGPKRYCPLCAAEYEASVAQCVDCKGAGLVGAEEMRRRGLPLPEEEDTRRFVPAAQADDFFTAQTLQGALLRAGVPVLALVKQAGPVDPLTDGLSHGYWELRVPQSHLSQARALVENAREGLSATPEEAQEAAAEAEREVEAEQR